MLISLLYLITKRLKYYSQDILYCVAVHGYTMKLCVMIKFTCSFNGEMFKGQLDLKHVNLESQKEFYK